MHSFYVMTENSIKLMISPLFSFRQANLKRIDHKSSILTDSADDFSAKRTINTHSKTDGVKVKKNDSNAYALELQQRILTVLLKLPEPTIWM